MLVSLVYDKILHSAVILEAESKIPQRRKVFLTHLSAIEEFFKFSYPSHVTTDQDIYHDLDKFLLLLGALSDTIPSASSFYTCMLPLQVRALIREALAGVDSVD